MDTNRDQELTELLEDIREACRNANHPLSAGLGCGYCIRIGELVDTSR
jgi:hypothetical protein